MTKLKTFIILGALVLIPLGTISVLANSNEYCNDYDYRNQNNNGRMHSNRSDRYSDDRMNDDVVYRCGNTDYDHVHGEYCNDDNYGNYMNDDVVYRCGNTDYDHVHGEYCNDDYYGQHMNSNRRNSSRRQGRNCHQ